MLKKIIFIIIAVFMVTSQELHAEPYLPYEVIDVQEESFTIRNKNGREIVLNRKPKGLKVGDKVRYNKKKHILKRKPKKMK